MTPDTGHPTTLPDAPEATHADVLAEREIEAVRATIAGDFPDYLDDLERLVNIDCGSYTPEGVNEVGRWVAALPDRTRRRRRRPTGPGRAIREHDRRDVRPAGRGTPGHC